MSEKNYLDILIESLQKKIRILNELLEKNEEQSKLLDAPKFDDEAFDAVMDKKADLIINLRFLDTGFEAVYGRARETIMKDRARYASKIRDMQTLITVITQRSTAVEASERRNDQKFKNRFRAEHQKLRQSKNSVQAVTGYYKSMTGGGVSQTPRYMDTKY